MNSWSFSALVDVYEKCPHRYKLQYVDKLPQPEPDPDGPLVRGRQVHQQSEDWFKNGGAVPEIFKPWETELNNLRSGAIIEEEWGFDENWEPCSWKKAWLRMMLDICYPGKEFLSIIDWKTGKKDGNEIKHTWQGQLYALGASIQYPEYNTFSVEFWYPDIPTSTSTWYQRGTVIARWKESWTRRANKMLNDQTWIPKANKPNCRFCPYKEQCDYVVQ